MMKHKELTKRIVAFGLLGVIAVGSVAGMTGCSKSGKDAEVSTESSIEHDAENADMNILTYQNVKSVSVYANGEFLATLDNQEETYADMTKYLSNGNNVAYKITLDGFVDNDTVSTVGMVYDTGILSASYDVASSMECKYQDYIELSSVKGEYCLTYYMSDGDLLKSYGTEQIVVMGETENDDTVGSIRLTFANDGSFTLSSDKDMLTTVGIYINDEATGQEGVYFMKTSITNGSCKVTTADILEAYRAEAASHNNTTESIEESNK